MNSHVSEHGRPPRRFTVLWPDAGGMAMFAELAQFLVEIPDARLLQPSIRLDGATPDARRLQQLQANLDVLAARGFWVPSGQDDDSTQYALPDFDAPPRTVDELGSHGQWLSLSDPREDPQIAMLAAALELPPSITAVVADDALDPRLGALDQRFRASRRPWLLLRLAGEHPTVGPLFGAMDTACWSCLSFRLLWNQPVRRWYHRVHLGRLEPIPVAWRPRAVEHNLPRFVEAARHIVEKRIGDAMSELPWARSDELVHPVIRRPQCPVCGDAELYKTRTKAPVVLSLAPRVWDEDGGFRAQSLEQTSRVLDSILSPISGLVAGVVCHSRPGPDVNRIFRAWFGKTTFRTDLPRTDQMFQTTMGKGVVATQSRVSAISESLERLASNYHGDEPVIRARADELPEKSFLPSALAPFSEQQYRAFQAEADPRKAAIHAMLPAGPDAVLDWTPVWSLTHSELRFVPFTWCYVNTPYDEDPRCRFFHNGGAAGNCLEEAILQGWLELVERDAVAIWWYNRVERPAVNLESLPEELARQLAATVSVDSDYWVLDVTHDLGVPVCVAVSRHRTTGKFCLGFGCHLDPDLAIRRALTELCQVLEIRKQHSAPFDFDSIVPQNYLFPTAGQAAVSLHSCRTSSTQDIADDVRTCVTRARDAGLEVLVLDYSRPDFPLCTAKVIMPGTCHIFPYRGASRLYDVPVRMGWLSEPLHEAELNNLELLI